MITQTLASIEDNITTDTFSWDTVFALKIQEVNDAIKDKDTSPKTMSQELSGGAKLNCTFDHWKISPTGDGALVHFEIPISDCTVSYIGKSVTINNISAIAELQLHYYDAGLVDPDATGNFKHLKVKTHKDSDDEDVVSSVDVDFKDAKVGFVMQSIVPEGLKIWLNDNLSLFDHIFATVNLNREAAKDGAYKWLYPTKVSYAFIGNEKEPMESMLGVLCMTEERSSDTLIPELSYNAIPPNSKAGFLISQSRFIKKMILPTLPQTFKGLTEDDFNVTNQGKTIELKSKDKSFTVTHKGKDYKARLEAFTLSLESKRMTLHTETKTEITPHIWSHAQTVHTYEIVLKNLKNGKQTLVYNEIGEPTVNKWTTQDPGVTIGETIALIIGGIILAILTVLTDGLILVAVIIIGGLLLGTIGAISKIIQAVGKDDAPDIGDLLLNCTDPIQWNDKKDFNLNQAALNGPLQLGGIFNS